ncbi:MAG: biosynthetic-type acetolactate synthase large subunit [Chloroflexi bacterium]|nr:biosynthetic-type acetolactate synthase large subunit [Chloroflexota bacterium]MCL5110213.1 biosynthetic-type acetolactate synthase large subunit [Chloroflexota bacterium]
MSKGRSQPEPHHPVKERRVLNGAQIACEALLHEGVEVLFGYPGGAITPFYHALHDYPLRHVLVRHEQAAAHAADGYARATGRAGVCVATSGPGATNLVTGIATAYLDSSPVVAITGQVPTAMIGKDSFQEIDITGITLPITKHNFLVLDVKDVARAMKEAFHLARTGRPGPVLVDLPKDVQMAKAPFHYPTSVELRGYRPSVAGNARQIRQAAALIRAAERPLILMGRGVNLALAGGELRTLAEQGNIPVLSTLLGLGSFPGSHPLFYGLIGMHGVNYANRALSTCDLVIAVGTRLSDRTTGKTSAFAGQAKVVHIDVDPAEIGKNIGVDIPIVGDVRLVLEALAREGIEGQRPEWLADLRRWREEALESPRRRNGHVSPQEVIHELDVQSHGGATIVTDVGQHQLWAAQNYVYERANSFISSGGLGTMGFGLPAALGAKIGRPESEVWAVCGDGGLQMNIQELATVVQEGADVKIALLNNGYLGMVRQLQELFHERRYYGTALLGPDFVKVADAYGVPARRVEHNDEIAAAFQWARTTDGPVLVEFVIEPEENVYPIVPAGKSLEDMIEG